MTDIARYTRSAVGVLLALAISLALFPLAEDEPGLAALLLLSLLAAGSISSALGFVAQWLLRDRVLPDYVLWVCAAVLMLPRWFLIAGPGPRALSYAVSAAFVAWFASVGAVLARVVKRRRGSNASTAAPEA